MPIEPGRTLGPYRIVDKLGAGGMGEVWRAVDTSLDREVAIKVLPDVVARDADHLARFEREARLLASLHHPGIAGVYGLFDAEGTRFLAMELVPGEDLSARTARGPLSQQEVLHLGRQVAEALEVAHEHGVIHRDLKPQNIRVTPDGNAKVLDFGLAKAFDSGAPGKADASMSPTLTIAQTAAGFIMGTAGYMSPEQAAGQPMDKRADVWSFGVVLYELLTGTRLFHGETISHTLADVLRAEIDLAKLPAGTPTRLRRLVARCLERDPKRRLRDIGEARVALDDLIAGGGTGESAEAADRAAVVSPPRRGLPWAVAAARAVVAAAAGFLAWRGEAPAPNGVGRFTVSMPNSGSLRQADGRAVAISPDGTLIVTRGSIGADDLLYLRRLDSFEAKPIPGTNGAQEPTFSPDGGWLAFTTNNGLEKVKLSGGAPIHLGAIPASTFGMTWSADGFLYYAAGRSLWRIPETGGEAEPIETSDGDEFSRHPGSVPSGKTLLYTRFSALGPGTSRLMAMDLATREPKDLGLEGTSPLYVAGYLFYARQEQVFVVAFDVEKLEPSGTPIPVLDRAWVDTGILQIAVSQTGTAVYMPRRPGEQYRLVRVDRRGIAEPLLSSPMPFQAVSDPRLSPDGRRLVLTAPPKVWMVDLETATPTLLAEEGFYPVWNQNSDTVIFSTSRADTYDLHRRGIDLSSPDSLLLDRDNNLRSQFCTADGTLIVREEFPDKGMDLWIWPDLGDESTIEPLLDGPDDELAPAVSPDGRWIAYLSDQSGADEIYVTSFPKPGGRVQVSAAGGNSPAWSPDGTELFYMQETTMMSVKVATEPTFRVLRREPLFSGNFIQYRWYRQYDVTPDGEHFVMVESPRSSDVEIVLNFFAELERSIRG